jgi:hypothetical protein
MPTLTTVNVTAKSPPTLIIGAQGGTVASIQIVNLDTVNTVYIGNTSNLIIGQPGVFPLGPLASTSFDGTQPVYGKTLGPTISVGLIPGGSNYSPGSLAIAGNVNATVSGNVNIANTPTVNLSGGTTIDVAGNVDVIGAGGYISPGQLGTLFSASGNTVAAGITSSISGGAVNVSTYASIVLSNLSVSNNSVAAGAAVCAIFNLIWSDISNNVIATDVVSVIAGSVVIWEIPIKGAQLNVQLQNCGTVGTLTISTVLCEGSYRVIPNTRTANNNNAVGTAPVVTGCTLINQAKPDGFVNSWVCSVTEAFPAVVATFVTIMSPWAGEAAGWFWITPTTLSAPWTIVDLTYMVQGQAIGTNTYTSV